LDQALWSAKQIGVTGNLCGLVSCTFHIWVWAAMDCKLYSVFWHQKLL
jgi:hypothetical protein